MVAHGAGRAMGLAFLRVVLDVVGFRTAFFGLRRDKQRSLILDIGAPVALRGRVSQGSEAIERMFDRPLYVADTDAVPVMAEDPVVKALAARAILSVPLPISHPSDELFLIATDARPGQADRGDLLAKMVRLGDLATDGVHVLESLDRCVSGRCRHSIAAQVMAAMPDPFGHCPPQTECGGVVTRFLMRTLLQRPGIYRRGDIAYTTLTRWRAGIKDSQIEALKALKSALPDELVQAMAAEMTTAARQLGADIAMVASVACGHSGPDCLADRLGRAVADRSGWPHVALFEPITRTGTSHPRRNAARPSLRLIAEPRGTVLIVDDVATSGQHLTDAARCVRHAGATSIQMAYIKG